MLPRLGFQGSALIAKNIATSHQRPSGHLVERVAAPRQPSMVKIIENTPLKIACHPPRALRFNRAMPADVRAGVGDDSSAEAGAEMAAVLMHQS
jgi:hypothetical protein